MDERQTELARHALGLDGKRKRSFRNSFVTHPGGSDHSFWMGMVNDGDAVVVAGRRLPFGGDDLFVLTTVGASRALRDGETLDPEDFKDCS